MERHKEKREEASKCFKSLVNFVLFGFHLYQFGSVHE